MYNIKLINTALLTWFFVISYYPVIVFVIELLKYNTKEIELLKVNMSKVFCTTSPNKA